MSVRSKLFEFFRYRGLTRVEARTAALAMEDKFTTEHEVDQALETIGVAGTVVDSVGNVISVHQQPDGSLTTAITDGATAAAEAMEQLGLSMGVAANAAAEALVGALPASLSFQSFHTASLMSTVMPMSSSAYPSSWFPTASGYSVPPQMPRNDDQVVLRLADGTLVPFQAKGFPDELVHPLDPTVLFHKTAERDAGRPVYTTQSEQKAKRPNARMITLEDT